MESVTLRDRFRGGIVGTAVGDALGAPFEGRQEVDPRRIDSWQRSDKDLRWTDDTAMTVGVAESLIASGGFDGEDMVSRFMAHHDAEPWRGYGAGPPRVFAAIRQGVDWREAASTLFGGTGSFGNGAAMRSAPLGLFACHDLELVASMAWEAAGITHAHALGRAGAAMQAYSTGWLATTPSEPSGPVRTLLVDDLRSVIVDPTFRQRLDALDDLGTEAPRDEVVATLGNGIEAVEAVPAAVHAATAHPADFAAAVRSAVMLGGDTDTIAAMAGALAGALLGYSAIPQPWLSRLEGHESLVTLADELLTAAFIARPPGGIDAG